MQFSVKVLHLLHYEVEFIASLKYNFLLDKYYIGEKIKLCSRDAPAIDYRWM